MHIVNGISDLADNPSEIIATIQSKESKKINQYYFLSGMIYAK